MGARWRSTARGATVDESLRAHLEILARIEVQLGVLLEEITSCSQCLRARLDAFAARQVELTASLEHELLRR
jgi:hypothetical protein